MGAYQRWARKQSGNPLWLAVGGISGAIALFTFYKQYLYPWQERRRLKEAEEFAKIVLNLEETKD